MLQIFAAVGLTGYLSVQNGQKAVNDLVSRLRNEVSGRIDQRLDSYMTTPKKVVQVNSDLFDMGVLQSEDKNKLGQLFSKQMKTFDIGYVLYGFESGDLISSGYYYDDKPPIVGVINQAKNGNSHVYIWELDSQGNRTKILEDIGDYAFEQEGWYEEAVKQKKPVWSPVYNWEVEPFTLSIAASRPIYKDKSKKELIGVVAIEQQLTQISDFLSHLKVSPSGKTFILEKNGLLIGSSVKEKPFTLIDGKPRRLEATNSTDPLIQATVKHLIERFGNLEKINQVEQL
ncbi:MAG: cache domain-containing protein, partial [Thermosynechococcaceae cyanobacterium]